jgi:hypothetical protein
MECHIAVPVLLRPFDTLSPVILIIPDCITYLAPDVQGGSNMTGTICV